MNFAPVELDETSAAFRAEVAAFCDERVTEAVLEDEWATGDGHNAGLHRALGAHGWVVPTWATDRGGAGLTPLQASILDRELRMRHAPSITRGTTLLVLDAVEAYGSDRLKDEVLPGVAAGEICFCLGYTEPDAGSDLAAARTRAVPSGDNWVINGQKMFTTGAQHCQYAFLVTRTNPDVPKHQGLTMFLCPLDRATVQPVGTLGGERTNMVFFDDHRISDHYRLGDVDGGWAVLMGPLDAEHGFGDRATPPLEHRGGLYGRPNVDALRIAAAWASAPGRDGRRPINDAITRRRLARMALNVEAMSVAPGPMGRILSADLFIRNGADLMDLLGAESLLPHGAPGAVGDGWIEYCHRFAQGTSTYGGTTELHRNIIAERILGLPRSTPTERNGT